MLHLQNMTNRLRCFCVNWIGIVISINFFFETCLLQKSVKNKQTFDFELSKNFCLIALS